MQSLWLTELKRRIRDTSQRQVAKQLRVSATFIGMVLDGSRDPGEKVLRGLGIRKVVSYEYIDPAKQAQREAVVTRRSGAVDGTDSHSVPLPALNAERVNLALAAKLNPRDAWEEFLTLNPDVTEARATKAFAAYCGNGTKRSKSSDSQPQTSGLFPKGELYSHLRPIERQDNRRPAQIGDPPRLTTEPAPVAKYAVLPVDARLVVG